MRAADVEQAVEFVHREGRLLERRIVDATFGGHPPDGVAAVLRGYQNPDGGFGHGLEPDKRSPASQPLDVEAAWQSLDWAGIAPLDLVGPACDFLTSIGPGVGCLTPAAQEHPHAPHWQGASGEASLNPTAALAGYLWQWSVDHEWRTAATELCWSALADGVPDDAHAAACVLRFLEQVPDRDRARAVVDALAPRLPRMAWLRWDADGEGYGVSPLELAPTPGGRWADLFPAEVLDGHLDAVEEGQCADGGWDVGWPTIGPAAVSEWRGRLTVQHLLVLRAYGRLP